MTRARMLRVGEVCERLGCCRSTLYQSYIRTGRLKMYALGVRTVAALESDVERLVSEMVAKGPVDYQTPFHARASAGASPTRVIHAPRGAHSEKPDVLYEAVERMYPTLPKLELFCRGRPRPGWTGWGNEALPQAAE
jgi:predicted DNA-binding transcriptional regulator AlpA